MDDTYFEVRPNKPISVMQIRLDGNVVYQEGDTRVVCKPEIKLTNELKSVK